MKNAYLDIVTKCMTDVCVFRCINEINCSPNTGREDPPSTTHQHPKKEYKKVYLRAYT